MSNAFEAIKAKLEKSSKGTRMTILSESQLAGEVTKIPTPTYDLNRILSGSLYHGVVSRTHTLLVGPEASGKSSFMCINLAELQKLGYTPVIIDAEGAWTADFVTRWGIDPTRAIIISTPWVEDIMVELAKIINEGWTNLAIALDSIGALESFKMIEDGNEKGDVKADQGGLQKKIKRLLKMLVDITKRQDSVSFSAGHYYGNPTGYGDPEQIGGGKYPRLAADYIVTLKKSLIYEFPKAKAADRGKVLGTRILAATIKNRYYPPFQESMVEIEYNKGVNKMAGLIDVAKDMGLITGSGWYTIHCLDDKKIQGEDNLYKAFEDGTLDPKPLLDAIELGLKTTGYSTANDELQALDLDESLIKKEEETVEEPLNEKPKKGKK